MASGWRRERRWVTGRSEWRTWERLAAIFTDLKTGTSLRLSPKLDIRTRALDYAPVEKRRYFAQLKGYQVMPDEELFNFVRVELKTPALQIISHQNARTHCSECGEEIINEREVVVDGKVMCQTCAYGGYLPGEVGR